MKYRVLTVLGVLVFSFAFHNADAINSKTSIKPAPVATETEPTFEARVADLYDSFSLKNSSMPNMLAFERAFKGYSKLKEEGKVQNNLLTIVDFDLSSTKKRMWILDMDSHTVLFNTYVAHGQGTGGEFAKNFSNIENSHQSSLGFYMTGATYYGGNGLSLYMDGMEKQFNSNARKRYIVIHGADYAEPSFIQRVGRLGRSYGCPAVPNKIAKNLINTIKGQSVVYIHKSNQNYLQNSTFLNYEA
ncbi:MAG: murein L,D-transpeptidase catalytic domain family protein [Christiangramia sp.]